MMMRRVTITTALAIVGLLLAGCMSAGVAAPSLSVPASASDSPSPTPAIAIGLSVSLDRISVTMSDGSAGDSVAFSDGAGTVALVSRVLGSTPAATRDDTYGYTGYDWGGVAVALNNNSADSASVDFRVAKLGSIALTTAEGIRIGSSIADVRKVASAGTEYTPDATNSYLGLEARPHPGTVSLQYPGQVGKDYVEVILKDGVVTIIGSPGGDWQDL